MAASNYTVDYNDKRLTDVKSEEKTELKDSSKLYDEMIAETGSQYQKLIDASAQQKDELTKLQQERTDFTIEQIEQQKDQAHKDYIKEQSAAYTDWQKQSDKYGVEAEKMASSGMAGTGYSESAQVSMYNTYQNRVATARESYNQAKLNYDNAIKDAKLQNNSALAEIALNAMQQQLELSLQSIQYKNQLLTEKASKQFEIKQFYSNEYKNVLNQINTENALAEEARQYNASLAEQKRQHNADMAYKNAALAEEKRQFDEQQKKGDEGDSGIIPGIMVGDFTGTSHHAAVNYLKMKGISSAGLLTEMEFMMKKTFGDIVASRFGSYREYLQAYVNYLTSES